MQVDPEYEEKDEAPREKRTWPTGEHQQHQQQLGSSESATPALEHSCTHGAPAPASVPAPGPWSVFASLGLDDAPMSVGAALKILDSTPLLWAEDRPGRRGLGHVRGRGLSVMNDKRYSSAWPRNLYRP
ncbi:hypothetical protein CORC01_03633 [Colletotrichum orchidophilum]|uniref:Uncharacterized protein n=1 Tax=Colletotrichum orchidophilum TaxID=1209926 RepID=A0A1G4BID7_9PEZI|nr:uncharacterized protein CORC01_03633 [Colletotrichum orchidophilum]OHF01066.1 hypothetical protein CORC01_03633 [Colletotrichum orchidophilum]